AGRLCLWLGGTIVGFFTLSSLWCGPGMMHWTMPGWLLLLPLLGNQLAQAAPTRRWPGRWARTSLVLFLIASGGAAAAASTGFLGAEFPRLFRTDPTLGAVEWYPLRTALAERGLLTDHKLFVTTLDWVEGAKIDQALGGAMPVTVLSSDPRGFAFLSHPKLGADSLIIARPAQIAYNLKHLRGFYARLFPLAPITIGRDGRSEITLRVLYAQHLLKPYPRAYAR
ncbi:MAG: hypothetical protein KGO02_06700, partial [Alphaproteobacteria bacterium]|nr:hypothetical protein [Alphaproteobacteria bacterium]